MDVDVETADWPTPFLRIKIRVEVSRGFYLANWILDNFPRRGKKSMGNRATTTESKKKKMEEKDGHFTKSKSAAFKTPFLLTNFLQRKRH